MEPWASKGRFLERRGRFRDALEMRSFLGCSLAAQKSVKIAPWSVRGRIFRIDPLQRGDSEAQGSLGAANDQRKSKI